MQSIFVQPHSISPFAVKSFDLLTKKSIKTPKDQSQSLLLATYFDKLNCFHHCLLTTPHSLAYNLLQQMSLEDFHRLENNLHISQTNNKALAKENQDQREEIQRLNQRIGELEAQVNNQPIHLITQQLDPLSQSNSLVQLEDKISSLTFQNAHLEQLLRDRATIITEVHTQLNELAARLEESQQQNEELNHRLRSVNLREERALKETDVWKNRLEKANQQRLKLISDNSDLLAKLKQEQSKNYTSLLDAGKEIISFKEKAGKQANEEPENKELHQILNIQLEEMQERNKEIARLKAINGNFGENSEVDHLKNTIKHLRGEISRYSNLVQHATEKLALAETTIQRYSVSAQKCDQQLASVGQLNERIQEQTQTIRTLQLELNRLHEQLDKEKRLRKENKQTLVEVLQENQCFHEYLFETYGDNFEELLKSLRNQYQERLRERTQRQKWATVDELIDVNERLRVRLKIA